MDIQRTCQSNLITSPAWPEIQIQVEPGLTFIGAQQITIYKVAAAEVFVFVEADAQRKIRRQLIVQFEHFLPHTDPATYRYNYTTPNTVNLNGERYKTDLRVVPVAAFGVPDPESDVAQVNQFIESRGYTRLTQNIEQVVVKRIMKELGEDRRHEILWIYREPLNPPTLLYTSEDEGFMVSAEQQSLLADFEARAIRSFAIL